MPNQKVLEQKKSIVSELANKMKSATSGVLVDYKGINVEDDTKLRSELRAAGVEYSVVKNTLTRFAAKEIGFDDLDDKLHGTTAMGISMTDPIAPAKILCEYSKKNENFKIKAGFIEGKLVPVEEIIMLAELPSKEVLLSQVLYGFNAPITKLAVALHAIAEKKSAE